MPTDWERDAELLEGWRAGDDRAGEQLFDRHADAVARFFENKVHESADDLTQTTFLRMVEGRERVRAGLAFRAYLFGIAHNVLREHLRQLAHGRELDPDVDSMADLAPGPITEAGTREEHRVLLEALRRLPLKHQLLLELFYWEKLKTHEIAEILAIPASTARTRLASARAKLGETLAAVAASPELLASTLHGLDTWATDLRERLGGGAREE
ncbi:RNA polymerase sigma factor [Nannocystaceae bacterium ST9]